MRKGIRDSGIGGLKPDVFEVKCGFCEQPKTES